MSPLSPNASSPPHPLTSTTSASQERNNNVKNATNTTSHISTRFRFFFFHFFWGEKEGRGGDILCNAIDDSLQDTGDTIHDSHNGITDRTKDGFDLLARLAVRKGGKLEDVEEGGKYAR